MMVCVCFSRRIEILDWWHMLQYIWQVAMRAMSLASSEVHSWVKAQNATLARSQFRFFFCRNL